MVKINLENKLNHLNKILSLYEKLHAESGHYFWRIQSLEEQIDLLEQIKDGSQDSWEECYREDLKEAKICGYRRA